jgi:hypothetical protein
MEQEHLAAKLDVLLGAGGLTSPAWLPLLHNLNELAATIAAIGGAALVLVRLAIALRAWARK